MLPRGAIPRFLFPPPHDTAIALFHSGRAEVLAPDVLTAAGIADDEFRLFISYVQDDTKDFVDLLHDGFTHEGWRVYVDRFRGTPGRQFPYQIAEELMGMGCVLLVESSGVPNSQWTQAEIAFALQYRLGLMAVHLAGAPKEPTIPSLYRHTLSASPGLADVPGVVEFVRRHYLFQRLRRANFLTTLWRGALALHGVSAAPAPAGVWTNPILHKGDAAVVLARRATDLSDLRRLATSRAVYRKFALGPADLHPPPHREDVAWLASRLHLLLAREDEANDLAEDMANGRC